MPATELDLAKQVAPLVTAAVGALSGGGSVLWFARSMFSRLVRQYDDKHERHDLRLERLAEKFGETLHVLQTKLAVLEATIGDARSMRDDIERAKERAVAAKAALDDFRDSKYSPDLKRTHKRIDEVEEEVESLTGKIEKLNSGVRAL